MYGCVYVNFSTLFLYEVIIVLNYNIYTYFFNVLEVKVLFNTKSNIRKIFQDLHNLCISNKYIKDKVKI